MKRMKHQAKEKTYKRRLLAVLLSWLMMVSFLPLYSMETWAAETSGDYTYTVNEDETSVTITKYNGSGETLTIPAQLDGKTVTALGLNSFYGHRELTHVTLPEGLTTIGENAFWGCSSLRSIDIPEGLTSILGCAFTGCISLSEITIPEGVTEIKYYAFSACKSLSEITIPEGITSLESNTFDGCSSLTSITIPEGVTFLGQEVFSGCSSLSSITIPKGVTEIGRSLLYGCSGLERIEVEDGNTVYDSRNGCNALIETSSNTLLSGCKNTVIPEDIKSLASGAFGGCGMTGITIPESVTSIGGSAFSGCSSLAEITIPEGVTSIGSYAFSGCSSLTDITIPKEVTKIPSFAFQDCSSLAGITIQGEVTSIGGCAFQGCSSLTGITIPGSVTGIEFNAFRNCSSLGSVTLPKSVGSIGEGAFYGCSSLAGIEVEDGNTRYDSRDGCNAIIQTNNNTLIVGGKNTVIPESVTAIGKGAFYGSGLIAIDIPEGVVSIGDSAFDLCGSLTGIKLPTTVTSIEDAFLSCDNLADIEVAEGNTVYDSRNHCNAIIETSSKSLIQGGKKTVIPEGVEDIGFCAFYESGLTSITIPEGVRSISNQAFYGCSSLTSVTIPKSVTEIVGQAFGKCNENLVIYGVKGSNAEDYAKKNNIKFEQIAPTLIDIAGADMKLEEESYVYDGTAKEPAVTVTLNGKTLALNTDYTVSYSNNSNVGTATVIVTGIGSYTGSKTESFLIREPDRISLDKAVVRLNPTSYTYDGKAKTPAVTVTLDGKTLALNTDYIVSYSNNTNVGTAMVVVMGTGSYTGMKTVRFTIVKAEEKPDNTIACKKNVYETSYGAKPFKIDVVSKSTLAFTSSNAGIAVVDNAGTVTIKGTGIATITAKAGNNSVKVTVKVSPKKASLKSVKAAKGRKLTVKWAKDKNASGYQVQVSTAKNFKKNMKQKNVAKTSYTFPKLKAGKKYYVRVRSFKKSGKETLYGAWSSRKQSSKVKK